MNLKDAMLCIDCDEVFTAKEPCNPQCPSCASSVYVRLSVWVPSWTAFGKLQGEASSVPSLNTSRKKRGIGIIHPTDIAA